MEELYRRYEQRAQLGAFSTYLVIQTVLAIGYITLVTTQSNNSSNEDLREVPSSLPEIVGHSVVLAICISLLLVIHDERLFKEKPWLLYLCSVLIAVAVEAIDVGLVVHNAREDRSAIDAVAESDNFTAAHNGSTATTGNSFFSSVSTTASPGSTSGGGGGGGGTVSDNTYLKSRVPVLSLYNLMVIYLFLPIPRKDVACMIGIGTSLICIALVMGVELATVRLYGGASIIRVYCTPFSWESTLVNLLA